MEAKVKELVSLYGRLRADIEARLADFASVWDAGSDARLFCEMCFCVCTPQTNAHYGWNAASALYESGVLLDGGAQSVARVLREERVRFHNNKAASIVKNRAVFYPDTKKKLAPILTMPTAQEVLCDGVAGWGLKEAAHFMRNIGFGASVSILDRHILKQLQLFGVIEEVPRSLSKKVYKEIDAKMQDFSKSCGIPHAALDLVFWYMETGELFK